MANLKPTRPKPTRLSPALVGAGVLVIALGFGLPMLTPGAAPAPEPAPSEPAGKREPPPPMPAPDATGIGASLLKLAVGLIVVCGLCVLLTRWVGPKPPAVPAAMEVLASIAVARCVLHLVRAGERRLLIGTDLGGVKTILELSGPEPEFPAELPAAPAATASPDDGAKPRMGAPAVPPTQEEILNLLLRLRARTDASPPA